MESKNYKLEDRLVLKKGHPCGTNDWEVVKLGADIKLKCTGCGSRDRLCGRSIGMLLGCVGMGSGGPRPNWNWTWQGYKKG